MLLLRWFKFNYWLGDVSGEWIIILFSGVAFALGLLVAVQKKVKSEIKTNIDQLNDYKEFDISNREYEILLLIKDGLSNKEISAQLFISESTVKTHVSNILSKLGAKRRTQAVNIAKEKNIISS